jgi:hypothetical protein
MPDVHFDLNALCIGHLTKTETDCIPGSNIYALSDSFVTEAEALGARITVTRGSFPVPDFLYKNPEELANLPRIDKTPPVSRVLEKIAASPCRDILLKVSGPYSVPASVVEPRTFYRWLRTNAAEVKAALERITTGLTLYISGTISAGVISLADPLREPRCSEIGALQNIRRRVPNQAVGRPFGTAARTHPPLPAYVRPIGTVRRHYIRRCHA